MPRIVNSPVARWAGSVTLADPLNMLQAELLEAGMEPLKDLSEDGRVLFTVLDKQQIPAILACVVKWDLSDFPNPPTVENFPWTPRKDSHDLIAWLSGEIRKIYFGELEIPNGSEPTPTDT
jgi:hypothetical protein